MITLDTSGLLAAIDVTEPEHDAIIRAIEETPGPLIIPVSILSEGTYLIERSLGNRLLEEFLNSVIRCEFALDCGEQDFPRILKLVVKYDDLPLGFADAAVIACAERHGGRVATLDHRHFGVVAREGTIKIVP